MTDKKRERTTSKASNMDCTTVEASRKKLADDFLAYLNRSWDQSANELLDRLWVEHPKVYFRVLVKLAQIVLLEFADPRQFDRRRNRHEVLQRLSQQTG
jgi:hypothetical protein